MNLSDLSVRYAYVDPASGRKERELKKVRARSAIVVVAPDWQGRVFILDAWAERISTDRLIDRMYETHAKWNLKTLGGEANGMQSIFQDAVIRDARLRGKHLPLLPIHQPTSIDKDTRIRTRLQPLIAGGRLFIRDDMTELKTEIAGFPLTPFKDCVDALASAVAMIPPVCTAPERDHELEDLLDYLRKTGAPPDHISRVKREGGLRRPR